VWKEKVIYGFSGGDGYEPWGTLIRDKNGALYGTTKFGGATDEACLHALAVVGNWTETTLHEFDSFNGTALVRSRAHLGPIRQLYGTTEGTVFELAQPAGVTETILHNSASKKAMGLSAGGVTLERMGPLRHDRRGGKYNYGTVWKITP